MASGLVNLSLLQFARPPRRKPEQAGLLAARVPGPEEASLPSVEEAQGRRDRRHDQASLGIFEDSHRNLPTCILFFLMINLGDDSAAEYAPCNREAVGLIPSGCWAFF